MRNAQSIEHAIIDLPEKGVIRFAGRNRNGKSIFEKWLEESISGRINSPRTRKSLVRRGTQSGDLIIDNYANQQIHIHIDLTAAATYIEFSDQIKGIQLKRYLADKKESIQALFRMFGLHYNVKRDMSLNIFKTFGPIMFLNTSYVSNFDMLNEALSDTNVDAVLEKECIFLEEQEAEKKKALENLALVKMKEQALEFCDISKEQKVYEMCTLYANIIEALTIPFIRKIDKLPDISFLYGLQDIPTIPKIEKIPDNVDLAIGIPEVPKIPELDKLPSIENIEALKNIPVLPIMMKMPDIEIIKNVQVENILECLDIKLFNVESVGAKIKMIDALQSIPSVPNVGYNANRIQEYESFKEIVNSIPNLPDMHLELNTLKDMYTALKDKVCPLCGHKLLEG